MKENDMTAEDVLARAADIVEFSGRWVNHSPDYDNNETCASFALREAAGRDLGGRIARKNSAEGLARRALNRELDFTPIPIFNDTPGRTKEEVAATLRNAKRWLPTEGAQP
jgi:hypothetical protein